MKVASTVRRGAVGKGPTGRNLAGRLPYYEVQPLGDPQGILQLELGADVKGKIVVEATLRVVHHPRIVVVTVDVAAFSEYWLVDAVPP